MTRWPYTPDNLPPRWVLTLVVIAIILILLAVASCTAAEIVGLTISTNNTGQWFTAAAGSSAVVHAPHLCHTATFAITGEPGVYRLLWRGTNHPGAWLNCWQTIQHSNEVTVTNLPIVPQAWGYFRLVRT